jgi:hypothetical protein
MFSAYCAMLPEIFNNIAELIQTLPEFESMPTRVVKRYHGEFEEGFDWVPVLPCALLYISNTRPDAKSGQAEYLSTETQVVIYVAGKIDSMQLAEDVANKLDGAEFEIGQNNYFVNYTSLEFYGYIKQVEIYKITVLVK